MEKEKWTKIKLYAINSKVESKRSGATSPNNSPNEHTARFYFPLVRMESVARYENHVQSFFNDTATANEWAMVQHFIFISTLETENNKQN